MSAYVKIGKGKAIHAAQTGNGRTTNPRTRCGKLWDKGASEGEELTCKPCAAAESKIIDSRSRLEYATRQAETQDDVMAQAEPVEPDHVIHYGSASVLCGRMPVFVGSDHCEGGDGPCPSACNCGCASGEFECMCENVTTDTHKVTCQDCRAGLYRVVDAPDVLSDAMTEAAPEDAPYGAVDASLMDRETRERALYPTADTGAYGTVLCPSCQTRPTGVVGIPCSECVAEREADRPAAPVITWRMIDRTTGEMVKPGTEREDSRGETWRVSKITRTPEIGKSGKVLATDSRGWTRELYPSVFGLVITDSEITPN